MKETRQQRRARERAEAAKAARQRGGDGLVTAGKQLSPEEAAFFGNGFTLDDDDFPMPPPSGDPVWDTSRCPVDDHCAGCGKTESLRVMISWFGPDEIACATVCQDCDGRSMLHLQEVGMTGMGARVRAHRKHMHAA